MAYQLFRLPKAVPLDSNAELYAGAKANFYATGTTTRQDTYNSSALSVAHANPVVADGFGVFPPIYLDPTLVYKLVLTTSADVTIYTVDPVNDQSLSGNLIGAFLYPVTDQETAATVVPADTSKPTLVLPRYGTAGDASGDDTAELQDALDVIAEYEAAQGGAKLRVPPAPDGGYYRITGANGVVMASQGAAIEGDGAGSVIYNTTASARTLDLGNNTDIISNMKVQNLNVGGVGGAGSVAIRGRNVPNVSIDQVNTQGTADGIRMTLCYNGRITSTTVGGITTYGLHLTDSANSMFIAGLRVDGEPTGLSFTPGTVGAHVSGSGNVMQGTFQTVETMVDLVGSRGSWTWVYGETYETGVKISSTDARNNVIGGYFSSLGAEHSIVVEAGVGVRIDNVCCIGGTHSGTTVSKGGCPIKLTTGPSNVTIGRNISHVDNFIVDWPDNHIALGQRMEADLWPVHPGYLTPVTHTGTLVETAIGPGYTATRQHLGTGSRIRVRAAGRSVNTNGTKDVRLKLSGTTIATMSQLAAGVSDWQIEANIDIATTTTAFGTVEVLINGSTPLFDVLQSGVTIDLATTNPAVTLTAQLGNVADSIILNVWEVQVLN